MNPQKPYKPIATLTRRISLTSVGICLFLVAFMTVTNLLFTKEVIATNNLRAMARIYYEDYFYAKFTNNRPESSLPAAFEPYTKTGFRPVTLRQLLTFDNSRLNAQTSKFAHCDKIATIIKITPTPPFTAKDYHLETTLACNTR